MKNEKIQIHSEQVKQLFLELQLEYQCCEELVEESHKKQMNIIRKIIKYQENE